MAQKVVEEASATLVPRDLRLTYDVPEHEVTVPSRQATILALLINELVANAIGHGLAGRQRGHLSVRAETARARHDRPARRGTTARGRRKASPWRSNRASG